MLKDVTTKNFKREVLEATRPVLIDFYAEWCGPCKMMSPVVDEIAEEMKKDLKVFKINIEKEEDLASKYGIMSIPTFLIFKKGKVIEQIMGAMAKDRLEKTIKKAIK
ncbi:MAG: thioredoxin [Parcubacteria group bacterium CG10_big_fil_rev_8_21_14_0_10_36_14]|nr:MAG: thioredoxin [Parcubacteria group bacterium CG10_big_fil_rev_8_21_14_0_10_36_14]